MRISTLWILLASVILICSCSGVNPVATDNTSPESYAATGETAIAGSGRIILDPETNTGWIEPDRNPEYHYDVTSLLASGCPGGCFKFQIQSVIGDVWTIELSIENPTSLQVPDVRLLYTDLYGKKVLNPDGYIDLFGYTFKPFTAFAKEYTNRAFPVGPGAIDTEILELLYPSGNSSYVEYLIEVSLGGNCDEPWKVEGRVSDIPQSGGTVTINASVWDWQDDTNECWCDMSAYGFGTYQMQVISEGNGFRGYQLEVTAPAGLPTGTYPLILSTKPVKPNMYNIIYANVVEDMEPINLSDDDIDNFLNFTSKTIGTYLDKIYVTWSEDYTGDTRSEIVLKEYNGSWLEKTLVSWETTAADIFVNPSIAVNQSNGDLHITWEGLYNSEMSLSYRNRKGVTWNNPAVLFTGAFCMDSQIDVENNGEVHIVWQDAEGPFMGIFYLHDPGSGTFDPVFPLAFPATPMDVYYAPAIAHDSEGLVHVPITTGFGGDNNIGYKLWTGSSWSGYQWILHDNASMWQDITVAPDRKATMVYRKDDLNLWMKQWTGTWESGEHQATHMEDLYGVPNIDSDSLGNIHMAYTGTATGDKDIYYTVYDESTKIWSDPVNISDNASDSKNPALIVDSNDKAHIVWQDNADGDYDVYYVVK